VGEDRAHGASGHDGRTPIGRLRCQLTFESVGEIDRGRRVVQRIECENKVPRVEELLHRTQRDRRLPRPPDIDEHDILPMLAEGQPETLDVMCASDLEFQ
jgi:hypothetical protein